jgi:hypothetical protein
MVKQIEIRWPFRGIDESSAFTRQRGGQDVYSTASCNNVVGFDPSTGRNRGASRSGTRKYCPALVNGGAAGQCIVPVIGSVEIANRQVTATSTPSNALRVTVSGVSRDLGPNTPTYAGTLETTIVAVAGGTIAKISSAGVTQIDSGVKALSSLPRRIFAEAFFKDVYFCDGANYKFFDVSANLISTWEATNGGAMPEQVLPTKPIAFAYNSVPIIIDLLDHGFQTDDEVTITGALGNTAANGTWRIIVSTEDRFTLTGSDGNGGYTGGGQCSAILMGSRCSLIAVWGGRIVLSGLRSDPNNIFMSAVGDPFNFDYSPPVQTVQQAVAGSITTGYGKNPDIVTAIIPYTDDVLLIGGTRSIRKFLGNPAEGGINVSVTEITGVAYGAAWCQSPEGIIYFFGSRGGVYRMDPESGVPNRLTSMTIDERLADIDLDANVVSLLWDDRAIAVRIYITPISGGPAVNYVWDVRNEAWWPFSYANNVHNPFSIHLLSGTRPEDRIILEYGQDGYVRMVDIDAPTDDGTEINSFMFLGPFSDAMLIQLETTLSETSNDVTWSVCTSRTEELALTATPRLMGKFTKGRNMTQWPRVYIERGYLKLSASGRWAMEKVMAGMDQISDTAKRVMRSKP